MADEAGSIPFQRFLKPSRRRRKRKNLTLFQPNPDFTCDEATQTLLERHEHPPKTTPSLPVLLLERETFGVRSRLRKPWKQRVLLDGTNAYRSHCRRNWKFRELQTPASDAVLALDSQGIFLIALQCKDDTLSLRMYGMSSAGKPVQLLRTLRLTNEHTIQHAEDMEQHLLLAEFDIPAPARVPVRIWLSQDNRLGVCMVRPKVNGLETLVLFPLSPCSKPSNWWLRNIHIPCQSCIDINSFLDATFLWQVDRIPHQDPPHKRLLCRHYVRMQGYLLFIDEGDGLRMAWIRETAWNSTHHTLTEQLWEELSNVVRSTDKTRILAPINDTSSEWEHEGESDPFFTIAFNAFFSASSLLHSLLTKNPKLVTPRFDASAAVLPNFDYHIVGVQDSGRVIELLLVFSVGAIGKGCVGVFVQVDIFTQDYITTKWIRLTQVDTPPIDCGCLARGQRKRYTRDSLLYPDAVAINNIAVRRQKAVASISARDMPVVLTYM